MNAYAVGCFHLFTLKGRRCLVLNLDNPSIVPHRAKFYDRVLTFGNLRIYIAGDVKVTERALRTRSGEATDRVGSVIMFEDIDLVKTREGKLALVRAVAETDDTTAVFIGNTIDTEYFNATVCGEIEDGQENSDDDAVFSEINNGYIGKVIYSKRSTVSTNLNDDARSSAEATYHMVVAIIRQDTIVRRGPLCDGEAAYLYTHNDDGEFVVAWIEQGYDACTGYIKDRIEKTYDYIFGNPTAIDLLDNDLWNPYANTAD